jgi:hypothetical protein
LTLELNRLRGIKMRREPVADMPVDVAAEPVALACQYFHPVYVPAARTIMAIDINATLVKFDRNGVWQ